MPVYCFEMQERFFLSVEGVGYIETAFEKNHIKIRDP